MGSGTVGTQTGTPSKCDLTCSTTLQVPGAFLRVQGPLSYISFICNLRRKYCPHEKSEAQGNVSLVQGDPFGSYNLARSPCDSGVEAKLIGD